MKLDKRLQAATLGRRRSRRFVRFVAPVVLAGLCVVTFGASAATAGTYDFVGRWMNENQDASGITGFIIKPHRDGLRIRVFGRCRQRDVCDWRVDRVNLYAKRNHDRNHQSWRNSQFGGFSWNFGSRRDNVDMVTVRFDAGYARKLMVLKRERGNQLRVEVFTMFPDSRDRPGYVTESRFERWGRMPGFDGRGYGNRSDRYQRDRRNH